MSSLPRTDQIMEPEPDGVRAVDVMIAVRPIEGLGLIVCAHANHSEKARAAASLKLQGEPTDDNIREAVAQASGELLRRVLSHGVERASE